MIYLKLKLNNNYDIIYCKNLTRKQFLIVKIIKFYVENKFTCKVLSSMWIFL